MKRVGVFLTMAVLLTGLTAAGIAQATTVSRPPELSATVTATVKPTRLPAEDSAPVTLTVDGSMTRPATCGRECVSLEGIGVRLDPQVQVDTEGLPTCRVSDIKGYSPGQARRKCGRALIGSGETSETVQFVETPPFTTQSEQLFFNVGNGKVVAYSYSPTRHLSGAGLIGTIRHLTLRTGGDASEVSFQLTFGKTWRSKGEQHNYLNGQCRTGVLRQRVTLGLSDGSTTPGSEAQRCTKRS